MTDQRTQNCTLCLLVPLAIGIGTLLFFYFSSRDSIANAIQNDLAFNSNQLLKEKQVGNATVIMNGRDALLKGSVVSKNRSQEIENIIANMPGIRTVDNQLKITDDAVMANESKQVATTEVTPATNPEAASALAPNDAKAVETLLETLDLSGIKFLFGNDEITEQGKLILDQVINVLSEHREFDVAINGHTDSVGDDELNLHLSQQRADSVLNYLTNNGIQSARLSAIGYGESNPIADNSTAEGRAINRRIEFDVSRKQ